jgi:hypothetical protein
LDNHLKKLLESIFPSKSLFLAIRNDIESLLELLLDVSYLGHIFYCFNFVDKCIARLAPEEGSP